ncbi:DUF2637 domain-containing protein [Plantactinospora sp. BC1]|uniref:DUF2637 domain-containing protein n=1 Tax=Plantactinospora sp. BC1 TaxID=2108470 RepID=UPI000D155B80|nr:DUF2637 domain-containing protein [Plantactinospora sp. BC1]AVT30226.1 DUF2637 domain-containing protein [Plantactinospora sp. BC1]
MLAIGGAAGAASFTHVHNVAAAHGQPGWLAWADAIVLELMSIAAGLELRRRKRARVSTRFPAVVLGCAVTLSLAAQVVEAEPSPIGWIAAAVPALGFLVMVKVALGYAGTATQTNTTPSAPHQPDRTSEVEPSCGPIDTAPPARPVGERSTARTVRSSGASHRRDGRTRRRNTKHREWSTHRSPDADGLLPAARHVRDRLAADGEPLTRAALADALRSGGHTVSNTRASDLLKTLKAESSLPATGSKRSRTLPAGTLRKADQWSAGTSPLDRATGTTDLPETDDSHRSGEAETSQDDQEHLDHEHPRKPN